MGNVSKGGNKKKLPLSKRRKNRKLSQKRAMERRKILVDVNKSPQQPEVIEQELEENVIKSLSPGTTRLEEYNAMESLPSTSRGSPLKSIENMSTPGQRRSSGSSSLFVQEDQFTNDNFSSPSRRLNCSSPIVSSHKDTHQTYTISSASSEGSIPIKLGRRIVDLDFLLSQILNGERHATDCGIADMEVVENYQRGVATIVKLKCRMCGIIKTLRSEREKPKTLQVNESIVLGAISTGIGYSQAEELFSFINIPFMSHKTFYACFAKVSEKIHQTALVSMIEAGREEKQLALDLGEVDSAGIPCITVIADGAWSKRSYGLNYDALSGVACIVGQRTSKLLYLGVRNKYCSICAVAESNSRTPNEHKCSKNWDGTSTSMEADIIVEGFKASIKMHGLKYTTLVGDGDSSVTKKLLEARPYGLDLIKKVECRNHLYRNIFKRIRETCDKSKSSSNMYVPPFLRQIVRNNCQRLHASFKKATAYRAEENLPFEVRMENLKGDILNAPSHVFGEHKRCQEIKYFDCKPKANEVNYVPDLKKYGIYQDLDTILHRLVQNVSSLLLNMDNNDAEHFNAVVCKFTGGKRINFSKRGQYTTRCETALISVNAKGKYHSVVHKGVSGHKVKFMGKKYEERQLKKRALERQIVRKKKQKKDLALADKDYGPQAMEIPDMDQKLFVETRNNFLNVLEASIATRYAIERATIGQSSNPQWLQERSCRLTASHFGEIIKMRPTSAPKKVEALLYSNFLGNEATRYGLDHEAIALQQYAQLHKKQVEKCGIFISTDCAFLAASPDGLIDNDGILEIKCPSSAKDMTPEEAIQKKIIKFATMEETGSKLKKNHNYFYQVQGILNIVGRNYCDFIIWTPKGIIVETIQRDENLWNEFMLPKLKKFYMEWLLPEIVDPRRNRNLNLRDTAVSV